MEVQAVNVKRLMNEEEFRKTNVSDLMAMWLDMMRLLMYHSIDDTCKQWHPSQKYNGCIQNIETAISTKLAINLLETKILLNYKKRCPDAAEA